MNSRIRSKPNGFNNDRVKRAVKEMHIEDYNVNHFYDMAQDSLVQPDEDEMVRIFGTLVVVIVDVGDFNVRYRWIKFGNNIELISLTENDSLFKYGREIGFALTKGSIDPSKGVTDVVDADLVDDSNPNKVEPCFFIAPENNICVGVCLSAQLQNIDVEALKRKASEYVSANGGLMDTIAETGENSFEDTVAECFAEPGLERGDVAEEAIVSSEVKSVVPSEVNVSAEVKSVIASEVKSAIASEVKPVITPTEVKPVITPTETKHTITPTTIKPTAESKPIKPVTPTNRYPLKKATETNQPSTRYPLSRLPPKPAVPYQQRRQLYNASLRTPSRPVVTPRAPATTSRPAKPAEPVKRSVIVSSNRLAPKTSAPQPVPSIRPAVPSNPSHTTSPAPTTTARVPRSGGSLPSYMRDTAASRAKQVTTPVIVASQRAPVDSFACVDG